MEISEFKQVLNNRNLKATAQRLTLLKTIKSHQSAMPHSKIQQAMKPMDRVTLYRNLESLADKGIIHKAYQEGSDVYYALCGKKCSTHQHKHEHIHFKCLECKTVSCQQASDTIGISIPHHEIVNISVHVEGRCQNCI